MGAKRARMMLLVACRYDVLDYEDVGYCIVWQGNGVMCQDLHSRGVKLGPSSVLPLVTTAQGLHRGAR